MVKNYFTYINESDDPMKVEVGDRIICKKGMQDGYEMGGRIGTVKSPGQHPNNYIVFDDNVYPRNWWVRNSLLEPLDIKSLEDRKKKKEELRLKYKDIDPYGEENWMIENKINESIEDLFPIGTKVIITDEPDYDKFVGEIGVVIGYHTIGSVLVKFDRIYYNDRYDDEGTQHDGYKNQDPTHHSRFFGIDDVKPVNKKDVEKFRNEMELRRKKKEELKQKMIDIDPYGEEDWENENMNESVKPKFIDLNVLLTKHPGNLALAEKAIEDLVVGEACIWYTLSNTIKNMTVMGVELSKSYQVFFNGITVDKSMKVEIVDVPKENEYIIGFPSGEVIYLKKDQLEKLKKEGLVKFPQKGVFNRQFDYVFGFSDRDYHSIRFLLDPTYKKPVKEIIEHKSQYFKNDIIICKGNSNMINVDNRMGRITDTVKKAKENKWNYLVEFLFHFSDCLHDGKSGAGNCWWVGDENIKGIYHGDMSIHMALKKEEDKILSKNKLEEHEIDDDYHINQLFKNKEKND